MVVLGGVSILGRRRQHPGRRARRLHHGAGDVRPRSAQRARASSCRSSSACCSSSSSRCRSSGGACRRERAPDGREIRFQDEAQSRHEGRIHKRHDEIWPELVALLKEAGVSDYSIHLDEETNMLFGVLWRRDDHGMDELPKHPVMQRWWAAYGRHHGDEAGQRAGGGAAGNRVPYGVTMAGIRHVAVIDIGKTNAKVALVDLERRVEIGVRRTPNARAARRPLSASRCRAAVDASSSTVWRAQSRAARRCDLRSPRMARRRRCSMPTAIWRCRCSTTSMTGRTAWRRITMRSARPLPKRGTPRLPIGLNLGAQMFWQAEALSRRSSPGSPRS